MAKRKTREQLVERFKDGARPDGNDFADLIESAVNCEDDGIWKNRQGDPLRITAKKNRNVLEFAETDDDVAFHLRLADEKGKLGLNIADTSGKSRIFISQETGNVGIGTSSPEATLDVEGTIRGIPVVDFQSVPWAFKDHKGSPMDITVSAVFPGPVIKAEAMLGSWFMEYKKREHLQAAGIEIVSIDIDGNTVTVSLRCSMRDGSGFFDDYFHGHGEVVIIATVSHTFYEKTGVVK